MSKSYQINMTEGNILPKIIKFSIPLMLSGMLQLFFNAADVIVVGRYAGDEALAAVGSTGALINLLINLFIGISIGASVLMGQAIGARDYNDAQDITYSDANWPYRRHHHDFCRSSRVKTYA